VHFHCFAIAQIDTREVAQQTNRLNMFAIAHGFGNAFALSIIQPGQWERGLTPFAVDVVCPKGGIGSF
jgi:hypothetical protein